MDIVGENNTLCREVEPRDFGMWDDRRRDSQQVLQQLLALFKGENAGHSQVTVRKQADHLPKGQYMYK